MHSSAVLSFLVSVFVKSQFELVRATRETSRHRHRRYPSRRGLAHTGRLRAGYRYYSWSYWGIRHIRRGSLYFCSPREINKINCTYHNSVRVDEGRLCQSRVLSVVPDWLRAQSRLCLGFYNVSTPFYFLASGQAVVGCDVVPCPLYFYRPDGVQHSRLLVDFHRILPANPLEQEKLVGTQMGGTQTSRRKERRSTEHTRPGSASLFARLVGLTLAPFVHVHVLHFCCMFPASHLEIRHDNEARKHEARAIVYLVFEGKGEKPLHYESRTKAGCLTLTLSVWVSGCVIVYDSTLFFRHVCESLENQ